MNIGHNEQEAFLLELSELSKKYGITIGGCGCCGSPFLMDHQDPSCGRYFTDSGGDNLMWVSGELKEDN